jgi:hypothetical protein
MERIYYTDGVHLFIRLDISPFSSKVTMAKIILNKNDLEKFLGIKNFLCGKGHFTDADLIFLTFKISSLMLFGSFNMSSVPYFTEMQLLFLSNP